MKTKHTPGPWVIDRDNEIWSNNNKLIAEVLHDSMVDGQDNAPYSEFRTNAKLIAAAPDLLLALHGFLHSVEHEGVIHGRIVDAVSNAKEAIKKATGTLKYINF